MADSKMPRPGEVTNPGETEKPPAQTPDKSSPNRLEAFKSWLTEHWKPLAIGGAVLLVAAAAVLAYKLTHKPKPKAVVIAPKAAPAPPPPPPESPLTGLPVSADILQKTVTAVVIENHTDARPQSGLSQAGVVYEALAEGGITRFEAFFLDQAPATLGPVRSLRTYFVTWGLEFNAPVAHAGGNADALDLVPQLHLKDMNEFTYGSSFYRTKDRYAPHNLYTSSDLLAKLEQNLHIYGAAGFTPSPRKDDSPEATPSHPNIHINYSYNGYQVDYAYDKGSNAYLRNLAGQPHIDRNTGKQIVVKNIVVEFMPTAYGTTRIGEQTVRMGDSGLPIGSNRAVVFRDGGAVEGTWSKASNTARTQLLDASGKEIPLDRGNTWYSIVPVGQTVTY